MSGRVVLITGAAGGIGQGLAHGFAQQGAHLVLVDRMLVPLHALAAKLHPAQVLCIATDLGDDLAVAALTEQLRAGPGRIDVLINNAGTEYATPLDDAAADFMARWDDLLRNNVGSMVRLTRAVLPLLSNGASVINQSSIWGHTAVAGFSAYVASKHAVIGVTRSLARELAPRAVRVNAVCPGWVRTAAALRSLDLLAHQAGCTAEDLLQQILAQQAVPELLEPADLAGTFLFLASDAARAITGQSVVVSHGEVMH